MFFPFTTLFTINLCAYIYIYIYPKRGLKDIRTQNFTEQFKKTAQLILVSVAINPWVKLSFTFFLHFQASNKVASIESLDSTQDSYLKYCDTAIDNMSKLTGIIKTLNYQLENSRIQFDDNNTNSWTYNPPDISKCNY